MSTAIFLIVPIIALLPSDQKRLLKLSMITIFSLLFFVIICTKNGPDFHNYEMMYNTIKDGKIFDHGEMGFQYLMLICTRLNFTYIQFRLFFISVCSAVIFIVCYKNSSAPTYSIFVLITGYLSYIISALRQYAVMVLFLIAFYEALKVFKGKKHCWIKAMIILAFGLLFHIPCAVFCMFVLTVTFFFYYGGSDLIKNLWPFFLMLALGIRVILFYTTDFLVSGIGSFLPATNTFFKSYVGYSNLFSFGLVSRIIMFVVINFLINFDKKEDKFNYFALAISFLFYISIPYDLFAGRLINATSIVNIVIFANCFKGWRKMFEINKESICNWSLIILFTLTMLNQLLNAEGYEKFLPIFGGVK